ncbi:MAG: PHP domain-containing protein, partial [Deinococcus sp.]|nr:PHP domain-containing protein [Deinococcus sp.]
MGYVHLHLHSQYSLLDGAIRIKDLVKAIKDMGMNAVALTDHGNLYGAIEFYQAAKQEGIKPIIGVEAYVAPGSRFDRKTEVRSAEHGFYHLILLAQNFQGYQNLVTLVSLANLEGYYYKPRVDKELLRQHNQGLIALSACLGGEIANKAMASTSAAEKALDEYLDIFGERFYIEIQRHGLKEQDKVNPILRQLANQKGVGMVLT